MASDYYYLNNYRNAGKIGISRRAFASIATIAADSVEGATVRRRKNSSSWSLSEPVKATFHSDGRVELSLQVAMKKGLDVHATCLMIQERVANAVSMMSEAVPFGVTVRVVSVG